MLERAWYAGHRWTILLRPLSLLYRWLHNSRKAKYLEGSKETYESTLPVVVVGNITAGGTGKTPLVLFLVETLIKSGMNPAVISRGYGGSLNQYPHKVTESDSPSLVGDEPFMIFNRSRVPVVIDPNRARAARWIEGNLADVDILILDDGFQHYGLKKDFSILVVDGARGFGNQQLIPEGPLRETLDTLSLADLVIINGRSNSKLKQTIRRYNERCFEYELTPSVLTNSEGKQLDVADLSSPEYRGKKKIAMAGIGHPQRFFDTLTGLGISLDQCIAFKDHHPFQGRDIEPYKDQLIIMTEKDWIKVRSFAGDNLWYLPVSIQLPETNVVQIKDAISLTVAEKRR